MRLENHKSYRRMSLVHCICSEDATKTPMRRRILLRGSSEWESGTADISGTKIKQDIPTQRNLQGAASATMRMRIDKQDSVVEHFEKL